MPRVEDIVITLYKSWKIFVTLNYSRCGYLQVTLERSFF